MSESTDTFVPDVYVDVTREQYQAWLEAGKPSTGPNALPAGAIPISAAGLNRLGQALQVASQVAGAAATAEALASAQELLQAGVNARTTTAQAQAIAQAAIATFVGSAPAELDTWPEVVAYLAALSATDSGVAGQLTTLTQQIAAKYTKPSSGIPAADLAAGVIPDTSALLTKADAAATYGRKDATSIALLGHSFLDASRRGIYDTSWGTSTANVDQSAFGYFEWAEVALGGRLRLLRNAGVGGNTSAQILARMDTDVLALPEKPRTVLLHPGVRNDVDTAVPTATSIANVTAIMDKLLAAGIRVIVVLEPFASADSATKVTMLNAVNDATKTYAATRAGVVVVDFRAAVVDPATGLSSSAYLRDTTHLNRIGASRAGALLASAITHLVTGSRSVVTSNVDPTSLGRNPLMVGTGGGLGSGVTGAVADGWTVQFAGAAGAATAAKVERAGQSSVWQQIAVSTAPGSYTRLDYTGFTASKGTLWNEGDPYYIEAEYEVDGDLSTITRFAMQSFLGGVSVNAYCFRPDQSPTTLNPGLVLPRTGLLRSPVARFPAGTTGVGVGFQIGGGVGCTFRFTNAAIRKATAELLPAV